MSYRPIDRNANGIVFFGDAATDATFESNSGLTYDASASALKIPNGGTIGSQGDADAIAIASDGVVTISQNLSITGDLTVNGSTTTVSTTNTVVSDTLIELNNGASTNANDCGIVIERGSTGDNAIFVWDESVDKFTLGTTTATGASTGNLTITTGTLVANVEGNVTGNVTGNADTATTLAAARDFTLTGQVTTDSATSFDGSGNAALAVSLAAAAITGQTAETSVANDDLILIYDTSEAALRKMTKSNFVSGLGGGGMSNFVIGDGTTTQTIDDGETITFADGTGAEFVVSATNTVTVNSVDSEIDHDSLSNFVANEHIDHTSVTITAGAGLTGGGTIAATRTLNVVGGDGITANADEIEVTVDDSTIELNNTNGSGAVRVKDLGITTAKLAADAVDGTKLADDAVNSEHYTDGSIDTAHLSASSVTEAKRGRTAAAVTTTSTISSDINLVTTSGSNKTLTLPSVSTGQIVYVKKVDSGTGNVIIQRGGSATIDGATTVSLYAQFESMTLACDGTNWHVV